MSNAKKYTALFLCFILSAVWLRDKTVVSAASSYGYVNATSVNIRSDAGTQYSIVDNVSNIYVTVLGEKNDSNGAKWYQITYTSAGKAVTGYIRYDFLNVVTVPEPAGDFAQQLATFPESYHEGLKALHAFYPNYIFIADAVNIPFSEAVRNQTLDHRKLVNMTSDGVSWRALGPENYNWATGKWNTYSGNWTDASKEVIAYYMDPRNFLDPQSIYMFLLQSYDANTQTEAGVAQIVKGTYLEKGFNASQDDAVYGGSYVKIIMEAAKQSNVSPYVLASTLILEQGVNGTSDLISGTSTYKPGYYNFFNYKASGSDVIKNGLDYAVSQGWSSRSKSIIGGAKLYAAGYIAIGQNTYYYKDFDVLDDTPYTHQYAQSIYDARSSAARLRTYYIDKSNMALIFRIPIYKDMPATPQGYPEENDNLNNYYFTSISVGGLSPAFSMYTQSYSLSVSGNTTVSIKVPDTATYAGAASFALKKGVNTVILPVKAQTGYTNSYTINVTASADCTLTISTGAPQVRIGDVNSDGKIDTADLAAIRLHLLGIRTLSGVEVTAADINSDKKIDTADLAGVRLHLLGLRVLS